MGEWCTDHSHHSHVDETLSDSRLLAAIGLNLLLTVVEAVAGLLAGSLARPMRYTTSTIAGRSCSRAARRIARWPHDDKRTFGYRRAEIVGAAD